MKKKLILALAVLAIPVSLMVMGQVRSITGYGTFRTVTATEDTQLTASTQQTAPAPLTSDGTVLIRQTPVGTIHIRFKGTDAADETLAWTLWAYKTPSAPAKYVANGTATLGLTETGETNEFYADTISITAQEWYKTLATADGAPDAIVNAGGIAELVFDTCEFKIFKVIIRDITGGGAEASTAGADYCTFW